jgi:DNA repair photolyase
MSKPVAPMAHKSRGAVSNPTGRFEAHTRHAVDDGWHGLNDDQPAPPATTVVDELTRSVICWNKSSDLPFDRSINPYQGCEHGCVYCYARPSHAYLGLSPGLDFETRLFAKAGAARVLEKEFRKPSYQPRPIMLGANTDPYQPTERKRRISRGILEVMAAFNHPLTIVTKSSLVTRDIDILAPMAERRLVGVAVSVTTLDVKLARTMEPRAASPRRRLETIRQLTSAGVPVKVLVAPVIPFLTDHEMESILAAAAGAGAVAAGYILLRLPLELKDLFAQWLRTHQRNKADHVLNQLRETRNGRLYDSEFGTRMRGTGVFADLLGQRFDTACRRLGLDAADPSDRELDTTLFKPPPAIGEQLSLF